MSDATAKVAGRLRLTHLDDRGTARMVDVGDKPATRRTAVAEATVVTSPATMAAVVTGDAPKGEVIGTARLAGIQAAKRTADLIPLAHPLDLTHVDLEITIDSVVGTAKIEACASTTGATGVEMEAMTACAVAALAFYDMVKGLERGVEVRAVRLCEKTGGKRDWKRQEEGG